MGQPSIAASGLGKRYILGENESRNRVRQALVSLTPRWLAPKVDEFWALRDVSFSIPQGEAVGIIGRNGAGKSTLLKVLSRVTKPTEGHARVLGRVATLLEVGTGFHPELTGRDNVFLSGTILGMTAAEVRRKFDEIIAFAEVEKFVDTPVKRYSSGMYVRLAFAVAAFLDPEILIVDEVLAVGDAAFQRKSLGKLNEAAERHGRTVLFVSHNLRAIRTFCRRALVLDQGHLIFDGPVDEGIQRYFDALPRRADVKDSHLEDRLNRTSGAVRFTSISCCDENGKENWVVRSGMTMTLRFEFEVIEPVPNLLFGLRLGVADTGMSLTSVREAISSEPIAKGTSGTFFVTFPALALRPGEVSIYAWLGRLDKHFPFDVVDENVNLPLIQVNSNELDQFDREGVVTLPYRFEGLTLR